MPSENTSENNILNSKRKRYTAEMIKATSFFQMPKFLFYGQCRNMSNDAKVLYSILRDRYVLSETNGWVDENGDVYIYYKRQDMWEILNMSAKKLRKVLDELKTYGLLEETQQGLNMPNKIYLLYEINEEYKSTLYEGEKEYKKELYKKDAIEEQRRTAAREKKEFERLEKERLEEEELKKKRELLGLPNDLKIRRKPALNHGECERHLPESANGTFPESANGTFRESSDCTFPESNEQDLPGEYQTDTSGERELHPQKSATGSSPDGANRTPNNTNHNNTDFNDTNKNKDIIMDYDRDDVYDAETENEDVGSDDFGYYVDLINENIEYDELIKDHPHDIGIINNIVDIMANAMIGLSPTVRIGQQTYRAATVKERMLSIKSEHIEYIIDSLKENNETIAKPDKYLLTTIFNAPLTIDVWYKEQVKKDMPGNN